jgi:hypothetical protein
MSNSKKGFSALIGAIIFGFVVGTTTISQVGLPQRVAAGETERENLRDRVTALEADRETARQQRSYILTSLNWNNCAIEAIDDGVQPVRDVCGNRPQYVFGGLE